MFDVLNTVSPLDYGGVANVRLILPLEMRQSVILSASLMMISVRLIQMKISSPILCLVEVIGQYL